eukprot:COSAG01_NODE_66194_length_271_cov_0.563953_2_plen_31_part_01
MIESRWVYTPHAFAGEMQPRQLNHNARRVAT